MSQFRSSDARPPGIRSSFILVCVAIVVTGCVTPKTRTYDTNANDPRQGGGSGDIWEDYSFAVLMNTQSRPFGVYDADMLAAIQKRCRDMLGLTFNYVQKASRGFPVGRCIVQATMLRDGSVAKLEITKNELGDYLPDICQTAILDQSLYAPWPRHMRESLGDQRQIEITFSISRRAPKEIRR